MRKKLAEVKQGPAQPLLRGVNLARYITQSDDYCQCKCAECPPWEHPNGKCEARCRRRAKPPTCNTGVALGQATDDEAHGKRC